MAHNRTIYLMVVVSMIVGSLFVLHVQPATSTSFLATATALTEAAQWDPVIETFDGVEMVLVPAGCFWMGSTDEQIDAVFQSCESHFGEEICDRAWFEVEGPRHKVCFDEAFWIDKYEVSNGQFAAFDGQAANASASSGDDRPRETITWFEARDFCASRDMRLPTEAEWEYAARGPDGLIYPWGNEFIADNVVYSGNSNKTARVGSTPGDISWIGALDLSGNVWEWTSTILRAYPYDANDGREDNSIMNSSRVFRGSAWGHDFSGYFRAAFRFELQPTSAFQDGGFRCARSYTTPADGIE